MIIWIFKFFYYNKNRNNAQTLEGLSTPSHTRDTFGLGNLQEDEIPSVQLLQSSGEPWRCNTVTSFSVSFNFFFTHAPVFCQNHRSCVAPSRHSRISFFLTSPGEEYPWHENIPDFLWSQPYVHHELGMEQICSICQFYQCPVKGLRYLQKRNRRELFPRLKSLQSGSGWCFSETELRCDGSCWFLLKSVWKWTVPLIIICAGFREQSWESVTGFFSVGFSPTLIIQSSLDISNYSCGSINQLCACRVKKKKKEASQFQWEQLIVTVLLQREKRKKIIKFFFFEPGS